MKFLHQSSMDLFPPALTPCTANFYDLTSVDRTRFLRINGTLIFLLSIRHDIRKEVVHLCTRNSSSNSSSQNKSTSSDTSKAALISALLSPPNHPHFHPESLSSLPLTHPMHAIRTDTLTPRTPSRSAQPTLHSPSTLALKFPVSPSVPAKSSI